MIEVQEQLTKAFKQVNILHDAISYWCEEDWKKDYMIHQINNCIACLEQIENTLQEEVYYD